MVSKSISRYLSDLNCSIAQREKVKKIYEANSGNKLGHLLSLYGLLVYSGQTKY